MVFGVFFGYTSQLTGITLGLDVGSGCWRTLALPLDSVNLFASVPMYLLALHWYAASICSFYVGVKI